MLPVGRRLRLQYTAMKVMKTNSSCGAKKTQPANKRYARREMAKATVMREPRSVARVKPTQTNRNRMEDRRNGQGGGGASTASAAPLPQCKVKRNYACTKCNYYTQNPRFFLFHQKNVHAEKIRVYECQHCLYASKHSQKLQRHIQMVHVAGKGKGSFKIKLQRVVKPDAQACQQQSAAGGVPDNNGGRRRSTSQAAAADDQPAAAAVADDHRSTYVRCSVCPFGSHSQILVNRHEKVAHLKKKFFRCMKCNYVTHMKARYTKHVKYHTMPMIKCDDCDFRTPYKWNLDRHNRNHMANGTYKCHHCSFSADIKQSLTVHEMNHHVPPIGNVFPATKRRYRVGASDAPGSAVDGTEIVTYETAKDGVVEIMTETKSTPNSSAKANPVKSIVTKAVNSDGNISVNLFSCSSCDFKSAFECDVKTHMDRSHSVALAAAAAAKKKQSPRPLPRLIPIDQQQQQRFKPAAAAPPVIRIISTKATVSEEDYNRLKANAAQSALSDFASLIDEDGFKPPTGSDQQQQQQQQATSSTSTFGGGGGGDRSNSGSPRSSKASSSDGGSGHSKRTGSSFFDKLKAKVDETSDLKCDVCQHESKCLSEFMCHQRTHGDVKPEEKNVPPVVATLSSSELKSTRCQHCRKRCKTSAELKVHLNTCEAAAAAMATSVKVETNDNDGGGGGRTIKREEMGDEGTAAAQSADDVDGAAHHPMENKIFVWNTAPACAPAQEELKQETIVTPPTTTTDVKSEEDQPDQSDQRGEFYSNLVLQPHQQFHRKEGKMYKTVFKCPHCTFWASTASRFHVHIVGHLNKKPFECSFCAYRSNWRWDITKHIRLKSARDNSHQGAKVLMTDETGRRNYTKYNRYLTVMEVDDKVDCDGGARGVGGGTRMQQVGGRRRTQKAQAYGQPAVAVKPVSGGGGKQASSGGGKQASSGGGGRQSNSGKQATSGKAVVVPSIPCSKLVDVTTVSAAKTIAVLKTEDGHGHQLLVDGQDGQVKKFKISRVSATNKVTPVVPSADNRKTVWKCKKCFFRDCDRLTVLNHVKAHYRRGEFSGPSPQQSISTEAKSSSSSASDSTKKEKVVPPPPPPTNNAKPLSAKTFILYGDDKTTLSCSLCDVKSRTQAELKEHMQKHIPQETKYRCEYCPFWSEEKKAMLDHMKYAHEMEDGGGGEQSHHPDDSRVKNAKRNGESDAKDEQDEAMEVGEPTKYEADDRPSMDMSSEPIEHGNKSTVVVNGVQPKEEKELGLEAKTDARLPAEKRAFEDDCQYDDDAEFPRDLELKSSECIPCNVCWYYSTTKADMAAHKQLHVRRGALYNCDRCVYNVTKLSLLYDHYRCAHMVDEPERAYPEDAIIRAGYREMLAKNHVDDGDRANETPMLWSYKDGTFAKVYKCRHCPHTNGRRHNTLEHEKMHSDHSDQPGTGSDAMHPCKLCTYVCNNAGVLSSHLKVHADDYNSVIAFWDSAIGDQAQIKALEHVVRLESDLDPTLVDRGVDDGGLKFCKWCPARYLSVADLRCHDRGHRFSWSYACQHCTYSARTEEFIALHRPLHEDEYKTRTDQLVAEHGVSRRYPRPGRSDKAKSPPPSTVAGGSTKPLAKGYVRQFTCTKCPGRFFKIAALQYHLTLHGGPGQHKCRRCDYAVSTYGNLIRHETVHEDLPPRERRSRGANKALAAAQPPPSPTSIADALKESSSSLKAIAARAAIAAQAAAVAQAAADDGNTESTADPEFGTQIHGNPIFYYPTTVKNGVAKQKRYKCPKCPSAFDKREQYKVHLTLHGADDKYKCDKCDYSVKYTANYVQHQRKHALHAELRNVAAAGIVVFDNEIEEERTHDGRRGNGNRSAGRAVEQPAAVEQTAAAAEQTAAAAAEEEQVQPEPETEPPVPAAEPVQDKQEPPQQEQRSSRRSVNFRHHHRRGGCAAGGEDRPTPTANNTTRTKKFRDEISDAQTAFELESAYAEVFKCVECPFVCGSRAELDKHVVHHSSKRWKRVCTFCTYVTQTESDLSDHMRVHFGRPPVARDMPPADGLQPLNAANDDDDDRQLEYYGKRVFERDEPHDVRDEESFFVFRDMGDRFDGSIRFTPKGCEPLIDFNENSTVKPTFVRLLKGGKVELPDKKKKKK
ncbi:uncharacterized protein LOC126837276 [Adelges cooleyi]|uniref:uncharacterized protein LOC126837276 n=1 Tax=Adelges cooleyi TaxID=133065 RepID=UPI00217FE9A3|nr:uncharacterized protein LOC126837276 [Adelges cooleyi]